MTLTPILYYAIVLLVWTTTPLAILYSQAGLTPVQALFLRMGGAWLLLLMLLALQRNLPRLSKAYLLFILMSGGGLFFATRLIYLASPAIDSGLIAVLHGLLPVFSALFATLILGMNVSGRQWAALFISFTGVVLLMLSEFAMDTEVWALLSVCIAVMTHALTAVLVKRQGVDVPVIHQLFGSLSVVSLLSLGYLFWQSEPLPLSGLPWSSALSILYLATVGSLLGFFAYYGLLQQVSPVTVGTITLITPLTSMLLGAWLNQEQFPPGTLLGTAILLVGLAGYLLATRQALC